MYNPEAKDVDLVREYSPYTYALFSRYETDPVEAYLSQMREMAEKNREKVFQMGVQCKYIRYAGVSDKRLVEIFYSQGNDCKPSPLLVFIHGGGWTYGNHRHNTFIVGPLVKCGYRVALVGYNSYPDVPSLKDLMEEFCGFVTWIFQYADRTQTPEITFAGHDVGAHLLAQLLHMPGCIPDCNRAKVKSMFFLTGIYDVREIFQLSPLNTNNMLGLDEQSAIDMSPILWCWKDEAPKWSCLQVHVLTVEHESITLQEQSRQFSQVLEDAGFSTTFRQIDGLDHYTIKTDLKEDKNEITNYIKTAMQKASASSKGSNRPCTCVTKR